MGTLAHRGRVALGTTIALLVLASGGEAHGAPGPLQPAPEIQRKFRSCLKDAEDRSARKDCALERKELLQAHRAWIGEAQEELEARKKTLATQRATCVRLKDGKGVQESDRWLKAAALWWKQIRRFAKRGGTAPGWEPQALPRGCQEQPAASAGSKEVAPPEAPPRPAPLERRPAEVPAEAPPVPERETAATIDEPERAKIPERRPRFSGEGSSSGAPPATGAAAQPGWMLGLLMRPVFCLSNCSGTMFSFGFELGYKLLALGFRYAYSSGGSFLFPDLRFFYDIPILGQVLFLTPFFEVSPMAAFGGGATIFQLILRPGARLTARLGERSYFFFEPLAFDLGVYTSASGSRGSASSTAFVLRYDLGFGFGMRF